MTRRTGSGGGGAALLYIRHHFEGLTHAEAWFALHPEKRDVITADSAKKMCWAELRWLTLVYPMDGRSLMEAHDLGYADLAEGIRELKRRRMEGKSSRSREWRDDDGNLHKETNFLEVDDNRSFVEGVKLQLQVLGLGGPAPKPVEPNEPAGPEPEPIPRTIEEAKAKGRPFTGCPQVIHRLPTARCGKFCTFRYCGPPPCPVWLLGQPTQATGPGCPEFSTFLYLQRLPALLSASNQVDASDDSRFFSHLDRLLLPFQAQVTAPLPAVLLRCRSAAAALAGPAPAAETGQISPAQAAQERSADP